MTFLLACNAQAELFQICPRQSDGISSHCPGNLGIEVISKLPARQSGGVISRLPHGNLGILVSKLPSQSELNDILRLPWQFGGVATQKFD